MKAFAALASALLLATLSGGAAAGNAEDLISAAKCNKCHTASTTKKGPSWASLAEKYKGKPEASARLVTMLKTGGPEDHKKVDASDADLKAIIDIVLSSK